MPAVRTRSKELYGKAADAAQSWAKEPVGKRKVALAQASQASNVEQCAVNPAVHLNAWANFGKNDFVPVVAAFKGLLGTRRCSDCGTRLYVSPRITPESLRCNCTAINFNLKSNRRRSDHHSADTQG